MKAIIDRIIAEDRAAIIATHHMPDWDALGFVFTLQRALRLAGIERFDVRFIPAGTTLESADFVGDTGMVNDWDAGRFDHHQLTGPAAKVSATMLVWEACLLAGFDLSYLEPLITMINDCDLGAMHDSRLTGIHALLSGLRATGADSDELMSFAEPLFHLIADGLEQRVKARKELNANVVQTMRTLFKDSEGNDILLCVLKPNAPRGCTQAAYEAGYGIVFYQNEYQRDGQTFYVRGAVRNNELSAFVNLGQSLHNVLLWEQLPLPARTELSTWYQHPGGFMIGLSEKAAGAADPLPSTLSLCTLADFICC